MSPFDRWRIAHSKVLSNTLRSPFTSAKNMA